MKAIGLCVLIAARGATAAEAPADAPAEGALASPLGPAPFHWRLGLGAHLDVLPKRVVQSEQRQFPQITAQLRVGLPFGFAADVRAAAVVISNQAELGASWGYRLGPVSLGVQDHEGVWLGVVGLSGFDASGIGFVNTPGASVGWSMGPVLISFTAEALFTHDQHVRLGDIHLVKHGFTLQGSALTLTLEDTLESGRLWFAGVAVLRTPPDYQVWIAFSDLRAKLPYPRFFGGYAF